MRNIAWEWVITAWGLIGLNAFIIYQWLSDGQNHKNREFREIVHLGGNHLQDIDGPKKRFRFHTVTEVTIDLVFLDPGLRKKVMNAVESSEHSGHIVRIRDKTDRHDVKAAIRAFVNGRIQPGHVALFAGEGCDSLVDLFFALTYENSDDAWVKKFRVVLLSDKYMEETVHLQRDDNLIYKHSHQKFRGDVTVPRMHGLSYRRFVSHNDKSLVVGYVDDLHTGK